MRTFATDARLKTAPSHLIIRSRATAHSPRWKSVIPRQPS
jgi:hypothetical protein